MAWTLLLSLLFSLLAFGASAGAQATVSSGKGTTQVHHMGIPYPAFSSHNSSHLGRFTHLQPRFQRLLRHGQDPNDKTQTAILVAGRPGHDDVGEATGARVVAALNPRNGEPVWRRIHNKTDPVTSMHTSSDVLVTLSGLQQTRVALFHALSGQELWSRTMDPRASSHQGVSDAALVPLSYTPPAGSGFAAAAPDVIVVDRDGTVQRFAGVNGRSLWVKKVAEEEEAQRQQDGALPVKVHATQQHVVVVHLVPTQASRLLSAFSSGQSYSLSVDVLSGRTGRRLSTFDVPGSSVDMASLPFPLSNSDAKTISNIAILGKDASDDKNIVKPQLVWLQRDGSVKSLDIVLPAGDDADEDGGAGQSVVVTISPSAITTVKPRQAARFVSLSEVPPLTTRGLIVAACNDGRGEVLRVDGVKRGVASGWEFEEEALDSVYAGSIDRKGQGYINRVFFGSGQKLLNFHVFWADANDGEGQVTGQSFQYDHDLHGDVFAAPFEVSQVSPFQLVTRATFVTASASVRMIQEDRHMWMREDGLSHTTASILIDLPEAKLGEGAAGEGDAARVILQGEGFLARLQRHAFALQDLPAWTLGTVTRIVQDIPGSMDNFKAFPLPGSKKGAAGDEDTTEMWKLPQNTMAQQQPPPPQQKPLQQKRPLGGVAAADTPRRRPPPPGVPEVNTRRVTKPANPDDVPPPTSLAPRVADRANVTATLVRDAFGLRKLLVATSEKGKIYAMDSQTGRFIWEKSLVGFGDGEGAPVPKVEIKLLALTRPIGGAPAAVAVDAGGVAATTTTTAAAAAEEEEKQASAQLAQPGLLTVIAHVKPPGGITVTRMWEIDPLTGEFPTGVDKGQTGTALFVGDAKDSFLLPLQADETGGGGSQSVVGVVDGKTNHLHVYPDSPSVLKAFESLSPNFVFSFVEGEASGRLAGYAVVDPTPKQAPSGRSTFASEKVWQVLFDKGEEVVQVARSTSLRDAVASQGKVLGNRQTLYKYLNPHALVFVTRDVVRRTAKVYVVDGIRGTILHEAVVAPEGKLSLSAAKPTVAFTENWITVSASVDVDEGEALAEYKGKHTQTRVVSIELYDVDTGLGSRDETWKWKGVFSSFASRLSEHGSSDAAAAGEGQALAASPIQVFSQVYVLPYADGLRAMAATRTRHGITQKALLASSAGDASPSTGGGLLIQLPRRLLDPRRVTGGRKPTTAELEEGLSPYEAYVHDAVAPGTASRLRFATGSMQEADCITAAPALLESTSVVFVSGLDWLVASVTPSGTFDILSASFNKPQLILTIAVLSVGLAVTKPMVAAKFLKARW